MLLRELHKQAQAEGGAVYMLNGNHESLNVSGNFRYATTFCSLLLHKWWVAMFVLLVFDLARQAGQIKTDQCLLVYQSSVFQTTYCLITFINPPALLCGAVAPIQTSVLVLACC